AAGTAIGAGAEATAAAAAATEAPTDKGPRGPFSVALAPPGWSIAGDWRDAMRQLGCVCHHLPCLRHRQPQRRQLLRRLWSRLSRWHVQGPRAERAANAGDEEEADADD